MEAAFAVLVNAVIAGANPIAVVVDQDIFERQELQRAVNIQEGSKSRHQLVRRGFIQDLAELDEVGPDLRIILGLDLVKALCRCDVLAQVVQSGTTAGAAGHLPAGAFGGAEPFLHEILVELLGVHIHAPAFAVDDHPHEVCLGRRNVLAGNLVIKDRPQEGGILVRIQQVERAIAAQVLVLVHEIERKIQRTLAAAAHHHVGGSTRK